MENWTVEVENISLSLRRGSVETVCVSMTYILRGYNWCRKCATPVSLQLDIWGTRTSPLVYTQLENVPDLQCIREPSHPWTARGDMLTFLQLHCQTCWQREKASRMNVHLYLTVILDARQKDAMLSTAMLDTKSLVRVILVVSFLVPVHSFGLPCFYDFRLPQWHMILYPSIIK